MAEHLLVGILVDKLKSERHRVFKENLSILVPEMHSSSVWRWLSCLVLATQMVANVQRVLEPRALLCMVGLSLWETLDLLGGLWKC